MNSYSFDISSGRGRVSLYGRQLPPGFGDEPIEPEEVIDDPCKTKRLPGTKKVLCVTTGMMFKTPDTAAAWAKIPVSRIKSCLMSKQNTAGGYSWAWKVDEEYTTRVQTAKKKVMNLQTGEIFDSITDAAKSIYSCGANISKAIRKNQKAGGFSWAFTDKPVEKKIDEKIDEPVNATVIGKTIEQVKPKQVFSDALPDLSALSGAKKHGV